VNKATLMPIRFGETVPILDPVAKTALHRDLKKSARIIRTKISTWIAAVRFARL
jgi:hypothetical protein